MGPKLAACSEMERKFVRSYLTCGDGQQAARDAGYRDAGGIAAKVRGCELLQRDRVLSALEEVGRKEFRGLLLPAILAMRRLLEKQDHPDHAKAVQTTLSRLGFGERSGIDVNVAGEVTVNHTDAAVEQLRILRGLGVPRERLVEMFGFSGLSRYEKMLEEITHRDTKVIEGRVEDADPC